MSRQGARLPAASAKTSTRASVSCNTLPPSSLLAPLCPQESIDVIRAVLTVGLEKAVSGVRVDRDGKPIPQPHSNGKAGKQPGAAGRQQQAAKGGEGQPAAKRQRGGGAAGGTAGGTAGGAAVEGQQQQPVGRAEAASPPVEAGSVGL